MTLLRGGAALIAFVLLGSGVVDVAAAESCHTVAETKVVRGHVVTWMTKICTGTAGSSTATSQEGPDYAPVAANTSCAGAAALLGQPATWCAATQSNQGAAPGPGLIAAAVWRLRLPASALHIQPVKGRTLVNLRTNFYAVNTPLQRTITLLGHRIGVRIWASRYHWRFGDGAVRATGSAGAPYPDLLVTHRYLRRGVVRPSLSTTYVAEYRIGGGAWLPVAGSANIAGPAQRLEVVTATPRLTNPYE